MMARGIGQAFVWARRALLTPGVRLSRLDVEVGESAGGLRLRGTAGVTVPERRGFTFLEVADGPLQVRSDSEGDAAMVTRRTRPVYFHPDDTGRALPVPLSASANPESGALVLPDGFPWPVARDLPGSHEPLPRVSVALGAQVRDRWRLGWVGDEATSVTLHHVHEAWQTVLAPQGARDRVEHLCPGIALVAPEALAARWHELTMERVVDVAAQATKFFGALCGRAPRARAVLLEPQDLRGWHRTPGGAVVVLFPADLHALDTADPIGLLTVARQMAGLWFGGAIRLPGWLGREVEAGMRAALALHWLREVGPTTAYDFAIDWYRRSARSGLGRVLTDRATQHYSRRTIAVIALRGSSKLGLPEYQQTFSGVVGRCWGQWIRHGALLKELDLT